MALYIISLDKNEYASEDLARTAVTDSGAVLVKGYSLPYTYIVDASEEDINTISGLQLVELADTVLSAYHAEFNTYHLVSTSPISGDVYNPQYSGAGSTVYLIDTGVNTDHAEFNGANVQQMYKTDDFFDDFTDTDGHGTAAASLIVGQNIGAAPDATLKVCKIFGESNGDISVKAIVDALEAILVDHNNTPNVVKTVCMPWVVTKNQLIDAKLAQLQDANIVLVAAAGNDGVEVDDFSPGGLDSIITVGAFDRETNQVAAFNNMPKIDYVDDTTTPVLKDRVMGGKIDLFAPGVNTSVPSFANIADYVAATGTSVSAAITAGAIAQYVEQHPGVNAQTLQSYVVADAFNHASTRKGILGYDNISTPVNGKIVDFASVNYGMLATSQIGTPQLTAYPSGTLTNVQAGQSVTLNLNINSEAANIAVLDFSPLSPWMTLDSATGDFVADTTTNTPTAPAIYNFAIRGELNGEVVVEEYSVGVYTSSEDELYTASEFYYDSDSGTYDEVISYETATKKK